MRNPLNPLTALAVGASGWILVMGINTTQASAAIVVAALVIATAKTRNLAPAFAVIAPALPVALSMLIIHAPYGEERVAPLLTADGAAIAGELALRFTALMACLVAAGAFVRVPDLAKALQALPCGNRLSYLAGSTLQLFPQGTQRVRVTRDANRLKARPITAKTVVPNLIMPVLTELLTLSSHRGRALETAGYDIPGPKTVLRPVPDSALQRAVRWSAPAICLAVALWL